MSGDLVVGVLGTGIMGAAMARNLAAAGHEVRVWNRTRSKAEALTDHVALVADTPAAAVEGADAVVTMVYDGAAALEVMREAAPGLTEGARWMQSTTVGTTAVAGLAAFAELHGLLYFDAPVLGTREPAEAGRLTVLAAGPGDDPVAAAVFEAVGARTVWIGQDGADGAATRLKLVANSWVLALTNGVAEVLALSEALGVDPERFFEVVAGGPLEAGYARAKADLVLGERLTPASFATATAAKDARLIVEAGARHGVRLDLAEAGAARMERATAAGHGDQDMAASYFASFTDRD